MDIQGYQKINYSDFQKLLWKRHADLNVTNLKIADMIKVKSETTVKNIFRERQVVSDEVLTSAMKVLKIDGFVLWTNGKRFYYVKSES